MSSLHSEFFIVLVRSQPARTSSEEGICIEHFTVFAKWGREVTPDVPIAGDVPQNRVARSRSRGCSIARVPTNTRCGGGSKGWRDRAGRGVHLAPGGHVLLGGVGSLCGLIGV